MLVKAIIDSGSQPKNVTRIISSLSDVIIKKLINFAIDEIGESPVKFAFIALGSVGREEQTLSTDQDNAIIFDDLQEENIESARSYFLTIGHKVCGWLDEIGYSYCPGNIMAQNPNWCQPLSVWKKFFSRWISSAEPQDMLEINIFFDFRCVFGDRALVDDLSNHIHATWRQYPLFISLLAENAFRYKPPMKIFAI